MIEQFEQTFSICLHILERLDMFEDPSKYGAGLSQEGAVSCRIFEWHMAIRGRKWLLCVDETGATFNLPEIRPQEVITARVEF